MEKTVTQIKKVEQKTHFFYCDHCGAQLGCVTEHSDGYYTTLGEFKLHWNTPNGWYQLNKCLCDTCRDKYLSEICAILETIGFKPDEH